MMQKYLVTGYVAMENRNPQSFGKTQVNVEHAITALDEGDAIRQVKMNIVAALNISAKSGFMVPGFGSHLSHDLKAVSL